jgi:hypothetical protein
MANGGCSDHVAATTNMRWCRHHEEASVIVMHLLCGQRQLADQQLNSATII